MFWRPTNVQSMGQRSAQFVEPDIGHAVAGRAPIAARAQRAARADRKSVVSGKSVSVRVDLGGRRIIKKKNASTHSHRNTLHLQISTHPQETRIIIKTIKTQTNK